MAEVETLYAEVQRVCDAFDKRFGADIWKPRLRVRKAGQPMAEPGRQDKLDRLEEVTIVQTAILGRLERKYDEAVRRHDEELSELRGAMSQLTSAVENTNKAVGALRSVVEAHEDGIAELRSTQVNLMKTFDQFIRGKEGNGRKQ